MGNPMTMESPRVQERLKEIRELLRRRSLTSREIQAKTGIGVKALRNYIAYLRGKNEIFIERFDKVGKTFAPCLKLGSKPDAERELGVRSRRSTVGKKVLPVSNEVHEEVRSGGWVPRCDWAASWIPIRRRDEETQT